MRNGDKQSEVTKLKREIIKLLYSNPEIIEILDNEQVDPDCPDTAEWVCIFPYVKLANIQEEVGTFIGVTIDSNGPLENDRFKQLLVTVTAFCPITNMQVKGQQGTRTDILDGDISETLNWTRSLGMFRLKLVNEQEGVMSAQQYYFRTLQFTAIRGNDLKKGQANIH